MSTINQRLEELRDTFNSLDNWEEKYQQIIYSGKKLATLPDELKTEENLVPGCVSKVWIFASNKNGRLEILADSEATITKGLVAILVQIFQLQKPEDILRFDFNELSNLGISEHLTMNRRNGLASMIEIIKGWAEKSKSN